MADLEKAIVLVSSEAAVVPQTGGLKQHKGISPASGACDIQDPGAGKVGFYPELSSLGLWAAGIVLCVVTHRTSLWGEQRERASAGVPS